MNTPMPRVPVGLLVGLMATAAMSLAYFNGPVYLVPCDLEVVLKEGNPQYNTYEAGDGPDT